MSSIQERLQLKRVPLDTWNIREQLCLASAVVRSGDQNWMSVSRALKTVGEANRPPDWYSQKSCAAQYGALLEHVETPKRKKRSSEGAVETPQESILKRLTQERIVEIQKTVAEMNQQYEQLKNEVTEVRNSATTDDRLREMWAEIEAAKRARERETARRTAWLKEREEKRARAERTWRPPHAPHASPPSAHAGPSTPSPAPPSSPLLTSLLKSSPVVTTPQHISHPANVVETVSPSAGAPTLSMLLEKSGNTAAGHAGAASPHDNKHAAIEHIKSQLVQIEQQLKVGRTSPAAGALPAVDIDDIEIKAEDVYAFRDVDLLIAPGALHKPAPRSDKPPLKKDDQETPPIPPIEPETEQIIEQTTEEIKEEPAATESMPEEMVPVPVVDMDASADSEPAAASPERGPGCGEARAARIEMRFPAPEIKVLPDQDKVKEEVKEVDPPAPEPEKSQEKVEDVKIEEPVVVQEQSVDVSREEVEAAPPACEEAPPSPAPAPSPPPPAPAPTDPADIPLPDEEPPATSPPEPPPVPAETAPGGGPEEGVIKQETEEEDSIPLGETIREESERKPEPEADPEPEPELEPEPEVKVEPAEPEETHTETDDDTPMELSREEEKDGKKRRDYSRKKKPDSRTCSGSESAEASAPESPGGASASDAERQHRLWKKSVMLVYSRLCAHKFASIFLRPISNEEAPGYSQVVKRPVDLTSIRRNIEAGVIRTTAEFQRDVLQMLTNALMYNSSTHCVYAMAKEMFQEAQNHLDMLVAAQAHAGLGAAPPSPPAPPRRKRRRLDSPAPDAKRPSY